MKWKRSLKLIKLAVKSRSYSWKKKKLEYDLQHKSQEMANLMINFVRKNEMLTEIKSEIIKVASSLRGRGGSRRQATPFSHQ